MLINKISWKALLKISTRVGNIHVSPVAYLTNGELLSIRVADHPHLELASNLLYYSLKEQRILAVVREGWWIKAIREIQQNARNKNSRDTDRAIDGLSC